MSGGEVPKLSVIIPCHDVAPVLGVQLEALARQVVTFPWEVIVVDNASRDGTARVALGYADRLPLRVVSCSSLGANAARNVGVAAARSDSLAFCDGDDEVADGWVVAMQAALLRHDYVTGPLELDKLNPPWLAASRGRASATGVPSFGRAFGYARGCNMAVRRSVLDRVGGLDETTACLDDQELGLRMQVAGVQLAYVPDAVVHYRYRTDTAGMWHQGLFYGRGRVAIYLTAKRAGLPVPGRFAGWRSWAWLVLNLASVRTRDGRVTWIWVLANRLGHLAGSVRWRTVFL